MSDESWILRELLRAAQEHTELPGLARALVALTHRLADCHEVTLFGPDGTPLASDLPLEDAALRKPGGFPLTDHRGQSLGWLQVSGDTASMEEFARWASCVLVGPLRARESAVVAERAERLGRWAQAVEPLMDRLALLSPSDEDELLRSLETAWQELTGFELAVLHLGGWKWLTTERGAAWEEEAAEVLGPRPFVLDDLSQTRFRSLAPGCLMVVPVGDSGWLVLGHSQPARWERLECQLVWWTASFLDTWLQSLKRTQGQQQAARMAALGQLAAGMAHEVNNPLGTIMIALKTLEKKPNPAMLEAALKATRRAQEIVEKLLRYSRSDQGTRVRTPLAGLIEEALALVRPQLLMAGVALEVEKGPPVLVDVCVGDVQQVLVNLVLNARDVSPRVLVRWTEEAVVEVLDDGPGVEPGLEERIFEPFFTTKPVGKGTGLGLAVSRTIAQDHGGTLTVTNRPEGGAVARLTLTAL